MIVGLLIGVAVGAPIGWTAATADMRRPGTWREDSRAPE